jgi:hypothetical protein
LEAVILELQLGTVHGLEVSENIVSHMVERVFGIRSTRFWVRSD